jgi:hypothetical protein
MRIRKQRCRTSGAVPIPPGPERPGFPAHLLKVVDLREWATATVDNCVLAVWFAKDKSGFCQLVLAYENKVRFNGKALTRKGTPARKETY